MAVYVLALSLFAGGLWAVLRLGGSLRPPAKDLPAVASEGRAAAATPSSRDALSLLLVQAIVIIAASRACARASRALGQPEVIGEIAAGICLGPSLLGLLWPESQLRLFPPDSLDALHLLSQIGLILFMFIVGMEINPALLKEKAHAVVLISHMSIILPFFLGAALSLRLYESYSPAGVAFTPFALFMGTAMSVTAFPVLARIIHEKGLAGSVLGTTALSCAAVDDVTAWCALAAVVGTARSGAASPALKVAALCAVFVAVMAVVIRPLVAGWMRRLAARESLGPEATAVAVLTAFAAALATESIGVNAIFGAFLAGVLMPRETALRQALAGQMNRFTTLILLPIFFALTGLRTQIGLLHDAGSWMTCGLVVLTAVAGKLGGSAMAARWAGMAWRDSLAVGTLMNARGLIELVVLNIGYDLGVITPAVFTMMVLMALITTFMTGPILSMLLSQRAGSASARPWTPTAGLS